MNPANCARDDESGSKSREPRAATAGKFPQSERKLPLHVLVVDDEPLIRWSVMETLSELGLDVEQASDARAALRSVMSAALPYDVVFLDLKLPDMNDLSLLATLRQVVPNTRLILMTAFGNPDTFDAARALGARVLHKPFELAEIRQLALETGSIS